MFVRCTFFILLCDIYTRPVSRDIVDICNRYNFPPTSKYFYNIIPIEILNISIDVPMNALNRDEMLDILTVIKKLNKLKTEKMSMLFEGTGD